MELDARNAKELYGGEERAIFLPTAINANFIVFDEGTGDNLFPEDIRNGYASYINWYSYRLDLTFGDSPNAEFKERDGGMILLKSCATRFTLGDVVKMVLEDALGSPNDTPAVIAM